MKLVKSRASCEGLRASTVIGINGSAKTGRNARSEYWHDARHVKHIRKPVAFFSI